MTKLDGSIRWGVFGPLTAAAIVALGGLMLAVVLAIFGSEPPIYLSRFSQSVDKTAADFLSQSERRVRAGL